MEAMKEKEDNRVRYVLPFVILVVGIVSAISVLSLAVSSTISVIGGAFIAFAVRGRRRLRQEHKSQNFATAGLASCCVIN